MTKSHLNAGGSFFVQKNVLQKKEFKNEHRK